MRTFIAFVLGAALVSATWALAGLSAHGTGSLYPSPNGQPVLDGLGEPVPDFGWHGPAGGSARLSELLEDGPVVVALRDLSCPLSQRYALTLEALEESFAPAGVRFLYVDLTPSAAMPDRGMAGERPGRSGIDARRMDAEFFAALGPRTTTEVFLIDRDGILRYRGAVDDQYGIGFARQSPENRYLYQAIEAVLATDRPRTPATFAPGCLFDPDLPTRVASASGAGAEVTYAGHIRTLVEEHCVSCHDGDADGPPALDDYEAVVEHHDKIRSMVQQGRMPPWPASPEYGRWANDPRLSAADKGRLLQWIETGMPLGEATSAPAPEPAGARGGWRHGRPDAVLAMPEAFVVEEESPSPFETFYIPTDFGEDRWVSAVEILPSAPESVVQAIVLIEAPDTPPAERALGLRGFFGGYAPGYGGGVFPPGTAKLLPAGAWLKLQIHYRPQAAGTSDRTRIGLTFADGAPRGVVETRAAFATGFEIPSHVAHHAVTAEHVFTRAGEIHSLTPHMHLRGSAIRYVLEDPRGNEEILLDIPRYYFQFRLNYVPVEPIEVEPGSTLRVTGWYDNSESNPANPDPSVPAVVGAQLTDELLIGYFDFVATGRTRAALVDPDGDVDRDPDLEPDPER